MFIRFPVDRISTRSDELAKYCKIENVSLESLRYAEKLRKSVAFSLTWAALRLLKRLDKVLHSAIDRLSVSGTVQRQLS